VIVGVEALIVPEEIAHASLARLSREHSLSREQIYFGATHTHSSLGGWGQGWVAEQFAGPFTLGVREWFVDRIEAAVREALKDLQPAQFGHGSVAAPQFVRNRLVGNLGTVDPDFQFLAFRQQSGRMGLVGSYAAHATVLPSRFMKFSGDYPGVWCREVESATRGFAMFLAGSVGSHAPVPGASDWEGAERMGKGLARVVLDRIPSTRLTNQVRFGMTGLKVELPELHARITDGLRLRPWAARLLVPASPDAFLQGIRLNDAMWMGTPCDYSGELAVAWRERWRSRGVESAITSFNGSYVGYVIPSRYYHLDGYESRTMSFFGPAVPDYFEACLRGIADTLTRH